MKKKLAVLLGVLVLSSVSFAAPAKVTNGSIENSLSSLESQLNQLNQLEDKKFREQEAQANAASQEIAKYTEMQAKIDERIAEIESKSDSSIFSKELKAKAAEYKNLKAQLEKEIAKVVRYGAKNLAMEETYDPKITIETIEKILGPARLERDKYEDNEVAGVVTGLAWTSVGGDILFIESALSKGKGVLNITGNLGQVMKESATIAWEYLKANAERYNLNPKLFSNYDVHIHVPEGATPKDGPSAGIAMLTSLMSLFTQKRVKKHLAMTGEITLRGKVLPVGGLKEKILAGKRAGIKEYILCKDNKKDILEIKQEYLKGLTFHYVTDMEEVIHLAITNQDVKHKKVLTFDE